MLQGVTKSDPAHEYGSWQDYVLAHNYNIPHSAKNMFSFTPFSLNGEGGKSGFDQSCKSNYR